MKKQALDLKQTLLNALRVAARYRVLIFVIGMAAVYGYVIFSINTLSSAQPSETSVTSEVTAIRIPKIDKSVVKQLEDLRDNSVSVQTLFEQARDNPFNE
jgi:P pilus assembly chaperone PapD